MKTYQETENGAIRLGDMTIPSDPSNRMFATFLAEVESGEAELIPYSGSDWELEVKQGTELWLERRAEIVTIRSDESLQGLMDSKPADLEKFIDLNVTDLESSKAVLKMLAKAMYVLAYKG